MRRVAALKILESQNEFDRTRAAHQGKAASFSGKSSGKLPPAPRKAFPRARSSAVQSKCQHSRNSQLRSDTQVRISAAMVTSCVARVGNSWFVGTSVAVESCLVCWFRFLGVITHSLPKGRKGRTPNRRECNVKRRQRGGEGKPPPKGEGGGEPLSYGEVGGIHVQRHSISFSKEERPRHPKKAEESSTTQMKEGIAAMGRKAPPPKRKRGGKSFPLLLVVLPSSPSFGWCWFPEKELHRRAQRKKHHNPMEWKEGSTTQSGWWCFL